MSNQFYRYLSEKLIKFLEDNIVVGVRYFINFEDVYFEKDNEEYNPVLSFYNCLKEVGIEENCCEDFPFKHDLGEKCYDTYCLIINDIKLVVVENINADNGYISELRNVLKNQSGKWKNSSLLIISQKPNDTIKKGTKNLREDGMPFSISYISESLREEINQKLNFQDKETVFFYLNSLEKQLTKNLWYYKTILTILERGKVEESDYYHLGLFPDSALKKYKHTPDIQDRLAKNSKIFKKIPWLKRDPDEEEAELKKEFNDKGVELLKREKWYESDFADLLQSQSEPENSLKYLDEEDKKITDNLSCWDLPNSKTSSGKRNRHIIIFNPNKLETISLFLSFNDYIKDDFIHKDCRDFVFRSGMKLKVNIDVDMEEATFKKVIYAPKDKDEKIITSQRHTFNISVINLNEDYFSSISDRFKVDSSENRILINTEEKNKNKVIFGLDKNKPSDVSIKEYFEEVTFDENKSIKILEEYSIWDDKSLFFKLNFKNYLIPLEFKKKVGELPNDSSFIWNLKRLVQDDLIFLDKQQICHNKKTYKITNEFKKYLNYEEKIISEKIFYAKLVDDDIVKEDIKLSPKLFGAYNRILEYYNNLGNVPSLVYLNDDLIERYEYFLKCFNEECKIDNNMPLSEDENKLNLIKLGRIDGKDKVMYSSLSPINIAYQLEVLNQSRDELLGKDESEVYERLVPRGLIPYLYIDESNDLYKPIYHKIHEWLIFKESSEVPIGITNEFIPRTITEKLEQFVDHFPYLFKNHNTSSTSIFELNKTSPININLIDISNDEQVVKGIFDFVYNYITENDNKVIPIHLNIYNKPERSNFEDFFNCKSEEDLQKFDISLDKKTSFDTSDIIRIVQDNINYYIHPSDSEYEYAHVSFFKVKVNTKLNDPVNDVVNISSDELETGLYLNGILSTVTSTNKDSNYRTGFGTKNLPEEKNSLLTTAIHINQLAYNSKDSGQSSYIPNQSIVTKVNLQDEKLDSIYNNSLWVAFIDPTFGIEYFEDSKGDFLIVHYNDQYTSSDKYDSIIVTKKKDQYEDLIRDFLNPEKWDVHYDLPDDLTPILRMFNTFNGEWLLDIISNTSEHNPEKLSFIAAIKYTLAILDCEDIIWIPVSMEEVLRVSGSVGLPKSKGLISQIVNAKKAPGVHSDDLLFIGLKYDGKKIKILFHPVEVKVGHNYDNVISNAENQIFNAYDTLKEILNKDDEEHTFRNMVFRNYFIQKFLSIKQNFKQNAIWDEKDMDFVDDIKFRLLNDDFEVSWELENLIGKGFVISFQKGFSTCRIEEDEGKVQIIRLPKSFVFNGLTESIEALKNEIQSGKSEFDREKLLSYRLKKIEDK